MLFYFFLIDIYSSYKNIAANFHLIFLVILVRCLMFDNEKYHLCRQVWKLSLMRLLDCNMVKVGLLELLGMNLLLFLLYCLINFYLFRKMYNFLFLLIYFLCLDKNLYIMNIFCCLKLNYGNNFRFILETYFHLLFIWILKIMNNLLLGRKFFVFMAFLLCLMILIAFFWNRLNISKYCFVLFTDFELLFLVNLSGSINFL